MSIPPPNVAPAAAAMDNPTIARSSQTAAPTSPQFRELALQAMTQSRQVAEDLAAINELVSATQSASNTHSACQRLANELAGWVQRLSPEQGKSDSCKNEVFVALADERGELELVAISNTNTISDDLEKKQWVESALRECLTRNRSTVWPPLNQDRHALLCHRQLARQSASPNIISIALNNSHGELEGALLVMSPTPLEPRLHTLIGALEKPIGTSLGLHKRSRKTGWKTALRQSRQWFRKRQTMTVLATIAILTALALIPVPYRVASPCEVQPSTKQFIAAPFDAQLQHCLVEPGDMVTRDQIIARFDGREINLELEQVNADLHRALKLKDGHVASHDSGQAFVAQFDAERLLARKKLLLYRSTHLESRSPIDGVVISGDLKQTEGAPLKAGQTLFEIAPLNEMVIEIAIPEDDVRFVEPGMTVRVRLEAFPFENWTGTIERVHPSSEIRDHDNVFVATVKIANPSGKLRPGMQGHAKTTTSWKPMGWILLHKPVVKALRWIQW